MCGYDASVLAPVLQMYAFSPPLEHARHDPVVQATYLDHYFAHIEWLERVRTRARQARRERHTKLETIILVALPEGTVGVALLGALAALGVTETFAFCAATLCDRLRIPPLGAVTAFPPRREARGRAAMISSREWSRLDDMAMREWWKNGGGMGVSLDGDKDATAGE